MTGGRFPCRRIFRRPLREACRGPIFLPTGPPSVLSPSQPMNARALFAGALAALLFQTAPAPAEADNGISAINAARAALDSDASARHSLIELIDRQLEREEPDAATLRELGLLLASVGQYERARETAARLEKLAPRPEAAIREILAAVAEGEGDSEAQTAHLRALCSQQPDNPWPALRLAGLLLDAQVFDEALAVSSRAAKLMPKEALPLLLKARSLIGLSRWTEAAGAVSAANRLDPQNPAVKALVPAFERLGPGSTEILDRLSKKKAVGRIGPEECYQAGGLLLEAGFTRQAVPFFEAATKISPDAMLPRLLYARALVAARMIEEAGALKFITSARADLEPAVIESFRASDAKLLANPGDTAARYDRVWHLNEIGQYLLALEEAGKIIEDEPKNAAALKEAAFALFKLGRFKEAESRLTAAIDLDSSRADAFALLGRIRLELADLDGAAEAFRNSLALQSNDEVRQTLERIQRITASR